MELVEKQVLGAFLNQRSKRLLVSFQASLRRMAEIKMEEFRKAPVGMPFLIEWVHPGPHSNPFHNLLTYLSKIMPKLCNMAENEAREYLYDSIDIIEKVINAPSAFTKGIKFSAVISDMFYACVAFKRKDLPLVLRFLRGKRFPRVVKFSPSPAALLECMLANLHAAVWKIDALPPEETEIIFPALCLAAARDDGDLPYWMWAFLQLFRPDASCKGLFDEEQCLQAPIEEFERRMIMEWGKLFQAMVYESRNALERARIGVTFFAYPCLFIEAIKEAS